MSIWIFSIELYQVLQSLDETEKQPKALAFKPIMCENFDPLKLRLNFASKEPNE